MKSFGIISFKKWKYSFNNWDWNSRIEINGILNQLIWQQKIKPEDFELLCNNVHPPSFTIPSQGILLKDILPSKMKNLNYSSNFAKSSILIRLIVIQPNLWEKAVMKAISQKWTFLKNNGKKLRIWRISWVVWLLEFYHRLKGQIV